MDPVIARKRKRSRAQRTSLWRKILKRFYRKISNTKLVSSMHLNDRNYPVTIVVKRQISSVLVISLIVLFFRSIVDICNKNTVQYLVNFLNNHHFERKLKLYCYFNKGEIQCTIVNFLLKKHVRKDMFSYLSVISAHTFLRLSHSGWRNGYRWV